MWFLNKQRKGAEKSCIELFKKNLKIQINSRKEGKISMPLRSSFKWIQLPTFFKIFWSIIGEFLWSKMCIMHKSDFCPQCMHDLYFLKKSINLFLSWVLDYSRDKNILPWWRSLEKDKPWRLVWLWLGMWLLRTCSTNERKRCLFLAEL